MDWCISEVVLCFFFFFQAEDGIRDKLVTGVQTCALPIFPLEILVDRALLPDLQGSRGEARGHSGMGEERRGDAGSDAVDRALPRAVRRSGDCEVDGLVNGDPAAPSPGNRICGCSTTFSWSSRSDRSHVTTATRRWRRGARLATATHSEEGSCTQ